MNSKLLWLNIQSKFYKLLSKIIIFFGYIVIGIIYIVIFGGILSIFVIPIVLLIKLL